ncbi:MAG: sulfate transporter CysZ [Gammaproteobacteria bacterium]|nr:MAG: sulfate transporter CysZ [Gammaproteobacteria bacterium]
MVHNFITGASYVLKGFGLIKQPGLRRFVLAPLLVNIIVFSLLIYLGLSQFEALTNALLPDSQAWWAWILRFVLLFLFWALALVIMFFSFTLVANLIAAPFNGLLAERVMMHLTGRGEDKSNGLLAALGNFGPAVRSELHKYLYFLVIGLLVGVFVLASIAIPVINLLTPLVTAIFSAWMLILEYIAYPADNAGLNFKEARVRVRRQRMMALGFGAAVLLVTIIPLVNFLIMPAAIAGATALWVDHLQHV